MIIALPREYTMPLNLLKKDASVCDKGFSRVISYKKCNDYAVESS